MPGKRQDEPNSASQAQKQNAEARPQGEPVRRGPLVRWRVLLLLLVVIVLACWAAVHDVMSPDNIRAFIVGEVGSYLNGRLEIGTAEFDPFRGVVLRHVRILQGARRDENLVAEVPRVVVAYRALPMLEGRLVIDSVTVHKPVVNLSEANGEWPIAHLIRFGDDESDPFPSLLKGVWAEAATVKVTSQSVFGDSETRTFSQWNGKFKPFSCSLKMWEFEASLRAPEWGGTYRVQGTFDAEAESVDAKVECRSLKLSPEFLRDRVPHVGARLAENWQAEGRVDLAARLSFSGKNRSPWRYDIDVVCHDVTMRPHVWPAKIDHVNGHVIVHNDSVKTVVYLRNLAGFLRAGNHIAKPMVNGLVDLTQNRGILQVQVRDLALAPQGVPALGEEPWRELHTAGRLDGTATIEISGEDTAPLGFKADMELRNCEFVYLHFPAPVQEITSRVEVNREGGKTRVRTVDLSGSFCGGRIENGSLSIDFNKVPLDFEYHADLSLSDVDLARLLKHVAKAGATEPASEKKGNLQGVVSGDVKLWGKGMDLATLSADGRLTLKKAYLWDVPLLAAIVEILRLGTPKEKGVQRGWAKCQIRDRKVHLEEAIVTSGNLELQAKGTIGFDTALDLAVVAGIDPDFIMDIPLIKRLGIAVVGSATRAVRKAHVTGTVSEPKVKLVAFRPFLMPGEKLSDLWSSFGAEKKPRDHGADHPDRRPGLLNPFKKLFGTPKDKSKPEQNSEPK